MTDRQAVAAAVGALALAAAVAWPRPAPAPAWPEACPTPAACAAEADAYRSLADAARRAGALP